MPELHSPDLPSAAENAALKAFIGERIRGSGPITFHDFMSLALYHPQYGYYNSRRAKMGRQGDYLTSPETHPIFGYCVARQLGQLWELMSRPQRFTVVEIGAARGLLCRDVLLWAKERDRDFFDALDYRMMEQSALLREEARWSLEEADIKAEKVTFLEPAAEGDAPDLPEEVGGCFLSNELLDSFPVHRVGVEGGRLLEVYVDWQGGRFQEEMADPSTSALAEYFHRLGLMPGEGCRAEVNLAALQWMEAVGNALARGLVITFDYGYEAVDLYAPWRKAGTLLCFYRHTSGDDPYRHLGHQDMTSHVDFTSLKEEGMRWRLAPLGLINQAQFLAAQGIGAGLQPVHVGGRVDLEEYYDRRSAVLELTDPTGLGRIKVLIQQKGSDDLGGLSCLERTEVGGGA